MRLLTPPRCGHYPYLDFLEDLDVWEYFPMDQGGRLAHLALIGSEKDADIERAVRREGFFDQWGPTGVWDALENTSREKSVWLNRWYFLPSLAREFRRTGDDGVWNVLLSFVKRWWHDNPVPEDLAAYFSKGRYIWRDMQVAWRAQNLTTCYFLVRSELDGEEEALFREILEAHAGVLLAWFGAQPLHENNHQSHGGLVMLMLGALFPDFAEAERLCSHGSRILDHHLEHAFHDDGNSIELCPGYYPFIVSLFRDAWLLCQANRIEPPRWCLERLVQFRDVLCAMMQPDGTMPPVNDSSEMPTKALLAVLERILGRRPAADGSRCLQSSGQAIMRSGDWYAFLDGGGKMLWHWHGGKLGFHLWHGGEPVVVDSGVCDYDDPLRLAWYCTPRAHNTLLVDGRGDRERADIPFAEKRDAGSRIAAWQSTETHDFATLEHVGFPEDLGPVCWVRHFVLVKGHAFLVVDCVLSAAVHDYQWLFHFAPGEIVSKAHGHETGFLRRNVALVSTLGAGEFTNGSVQRHGRNLKATIVQYSLRTASCAQAFCFAPAEDGPFAIQIHAHDSRSGVSLSLQTAKATHGITLPGINDAQNPATCRPTVGLISHHLTIQPHAS